MSMAKKALTGLVFGGAVLALGMVGTAGATHEIPQSAGSIHASLVPAFKQCGTGGNPTTGQHSLPLAVGSCVPRNSSPNLVIGPTSTGYANVDVVTGDVALVGSANDIQTPTHTDYNPQPAGTADAFSTARIQFTDHYNCFPAPCTGPYTSPGTGTQLDFGPVPVECAPNGDPATPPGSTCSVTTSANTVVPGSVVPGKASVVQVFRIRQADFRNVLASQQGIYIP
jgi:hypothetical protein